MDSGGIRRGVVSQIAAAHLVPFDRGDAIASGCGKRDGEKADAGVEVEHGARRRSGVENAHHELAEQKPVALKE